jgi:hypothetical protein
MSYVTRSLFRMFEYRIPYQVPKWFSIFEEKRRRYTVYASCLLTLHDTQDAQHTYFTATSHEVYLVYRVTCICGTLSLRTSC